MNERIQQLEKQCWETRQVTNDAHSWHTSFNTQKFAELIIQECISQIALLGISNYDNDDISWAVDLAILNIKDRFDVK